jgi:ribosomal protein S18 acetylase RimI-like enzyme
MNKSTINIRIMKSEDFAAVVRIDAKVFKTSRQDYYRVRFEELVESTDRVPTSLVAEEEDGTVTGFVMGELFIGEYGLSREAALDSIGVDPDYQHKGIGRQLLQEFMDHLIALGVLKVSTLVDSNDSRLTHFFSANQFGPSKTINLERSLRR